MKDIKLFKTLLDDKFQLWIKWVDAGKLPIRKKVTTRRAIEKEMAEKDIPIPTEELINEVFSVENVAFLIGSMFVGVLIKAIVDKFSTPTEITHKEEPNPSCEVS